MNRAAPRSRVPLGQRSVNNVENQTNGLKAEASSSSSSSSSSSVAKATIIPPSRKDSKPVSHSSFNRQASAATITTVSSEASSNCGSSNGGGGGVCVSGSEGNRAFDSLSSETLRRVVGSVATAGGGGGDDEAGATRKQPLAPSRAIGGQSKQNRHNVVVPSSVATKKEGAGASSSSSSASNNNIGSGSAGEPITIVEHRKRPCGDGHTVHTYLRGKLLGKGGFAKVYKVTSLDTNKEYAVKIVPKANLVKSRARQKLQTEIKIHRTMKHANICEYKHFFEDKVNCYILLELCHNHSMNEMIKRRKYLTEEETRLLMMQVVDAVTFMHDCNVIHRDLKLGNLFLSKTMNIKVGDFGLACRVDSTDEKRRTICGTPNYIAPEVIEGNKEKRGHSFEVDVWSMGVVCFTMLVGKPPYESTDVKSTYRRILANEYSFPQGKVSGDARHLIASMLQTDPKMRPSLDEIRKHPFFAMHQIPGSLPSTCTVSAPIWSTDEFGELYAIRPTSALDVNDPNNSKSVVTHKTTVAEERAESVIAPSQNAVGGSAKASGGVAKKAVPPKAGAASAGGSAFNIYDDVNDHAVEVKLESQSNAAALASSSNVEPKAVTPVHRMTEQMASCGVDDEVREMPPGSWSSPKPPSTVEQSERNQHAAPSETCSRPQPSSQSPSASSDDLHELVTIHSRLEECLANYERVQNGGAKAECPLIGGEVWGSKKWVTRYVDYTSKYGLGFLLNDGSSGVYFNDSTKAVHSATGDNFIYVERRGGADREPVLMYTMTNFPEDTLKKKVTLLQHFRSYLMEQQKRSEVAGEVEPLSSNFEERQDTPTSNYDGNTAPMVFMKKWIKTKHAMLFRLSNGTIQVLFYDMTEVLISSEGRLITFVDKEKNRFVHSTAEIANKQHGDVSRRLKYAKEILSQLISASQR